MSTSSPEPANGRHAGREIDPHAARATAVPALVAEPPAPRGLPTGRHEARRTHLLAEVGADSTQSHRIARRPIRGRVAIGGLLTAGLGAGLATALIVTPTVGLGDNQPVDSAEAKVILLRASQAAAREPELRPRPDQYLYFESESWQVDDSGKKEPVIHRHVWLAVDGKHAGLLRNEGEDASWLCDNTLNVQRLEGAANKAGRPTRSPNVQRQGGPAKTADRPKRPVNVQRLEGAAKQTGRPTRAFDDLLPRVDLRRPPTGCQDPVPAYHPNLPDDAEGMRAWLYRNLHGEIPPDVQAFVTVGDTINEAYIGSRPLAAMFAAAARIPGVTVTENAVTLAGRKGIAVGQTFAGFRYELIFDPRTYRYLGERHVVDNDNTFRPRGIKPSQIPASTGPLPEGTVTYSSASLRMAVTDRPGQVPGR